MSAHYYTKEENKSWLASLPKKSIAAKVIIKSKNNNILIVKPTYKKYWQLPGGGVDADEDPKEAAVRELAEELGLVIDVTKLKLIDSVFRRKLENLILIYEYTKIIDESDRLRPSQDEIEKYIFEDISRVAEHFSDYYSGFWNDYTS